MGLRVLLVEDDPGTREMVRDFLTKSGHEVEVSELAFGVASRVGSARPQYDVLVLDLMMPLLDGDAVLGFLARDPVTATTPVILFSAADQERLERVSRIHDHCQVVPKGRLANLLDAINRIESERKPKS